MTKADIVNEITKKTGIDKQTVLTTVEAFMDAVKAVSYTHLNRYMEQVFKSIPEMEMYTLSIQKTDGRHII